MEPPKYALTAGTTLAAGRYRLDRVIGKGDFCITYLATDKLNKGAKTVLKELYLPHYMVREGQDAVLSGLEKEVFGTYVAAFMEEAAALQGFKLPGIVQVIGAFEENGTAYKAMDYVPGHTLDETIKKTGIVAESKVLQYLWQIANPLVLLHDKGILHRDINPENIIITPQGKAVLVDFGNIKEFVYRHTPWLTAKLNPCAPLEQYNRHASRGPYSDIYALGAVAYYALTATRMVRATDRLQAPLAAPQMFNPKISDRVDQAVMKALAIRPEDRHPSVAAFLAELVPEELRQTYAFKHLDDMMDPAAEKNTVWQLSFKMGWVQWLVLALVLGIVAVGIIANL